MINKIKESIRNTIEILQFVSNDLSRDIEKAGLKIREAVQSGGKIILFGNGGSAADAQHIAAEFVGRFRKEREGLPAIALTTNTSILTSIGNDFGFKEIFSRQLSAMLDEKDIVLAISTSGNSENVIEGIKKAKEKNAYVIGLTGFDGGKMAELSDLNLKVPSKVTSQIQEGHIVIGHILCMLAEE